jgi:UDP-glucose 4-epimerase
VRYLVTGGAGFIGSHLCEGLLERGDDVVAVDDLSTGGLENVAHLESDRFRCVVASCGDTEVMRELVQRCDRIFHLAAAVGVKLVVKSPVRTIEANVHLTEVVLRLAHERSRPILLTSSSEVYGKSEQLPFREDADLVLGPPHKGRWSYACSKALDEFLALAYWKEKRLPAVVARLFNTVGPRQTERYGMVIPTFVRQALAGLPITVFGDGRQSRCFTHVADVVRALIALLDAPAAHGQVYNVGSPAELTIGELARRICDVCQSPSSIVNIPYDIAYEDGFEDMSRRVPDIEKIRAAVGWFPRLEVPQILEDVVSYARRGPLK